MPRCMHFTRFLLFFGRKAFIIKTLKGGLKVKIRVMVSDENRESVIKTLSDAGIETDDGSPFILIEENRLPSHLSVKNKDGERVMAATDDIIYFESYQHTVSVVTTDGRYYTGDRIYRLAGILDPTKFIRISNSVIIRRDKVKTIIPSFSMKYVLVMQNGDRLDVTRTYYNIFKDYFGI